RYANQADVSVSVAITQRGVTGISRLSLAPLVGTRRSVDDHAQPYSRGREWCASQLARSATYAPGQLTQALPTLQHFIFEGGCRERGRAWGGRSTSAQYRALHIHAAHTLTPPLFRSPARRPRKEFFPHFVHPGAGAGLPRGRPRHRSQRR